jgi:pimeloyl-ACP methyl ester carboxylesterase
MVQDLQAFCEKLGLESVIGAGHSLGGEVVALAAEQSPGLFNRLVLLEPVVIIHPSRNGTGDQSPPRRRRTWGSREELHEYLMQHPTVGRWRDDVILDVVNHEAWERPDGLIDMKWSPESMNHNEAHREQSDLKPVLRALDLPMLFIVSGLREANFRDVAPIASETPNFHLTTVEDTDHNMYMERPDAVASLITDFVHDRPIPEVI